MFVKTLDELRANGVEMVLCGGKARTVRFLNKDDGLGFSLSDVRLAKGMETVLWYKNHWEANFIAEGRGKVTDLGTGESWPLAPGSLYTVGPNDRHLVEPDADMHIVSVFNPPLTGREAHDADGSYEPSGPLPPGQPHMFVRSVDELLAAGKAKTVAQETSRAVRMLLADDGIGFTLSDVSLKAGAKNRLWYKNHWEANYILEGEGAVEDLNTGEAWPMVPGMLYCVGPKDLHSMHAHTDLHLLSIFCPALKGDENHDADGAYAPSGPVPPGPEGY